jgi:hypothetical protein
MLGAARIRRGWLIWLGAVPVLLIITWNFYIHLERSLPPL